MSGVPDYPLEETIDFLFTSRAFATGVPTVLTSGTVVIYENEGLTPITAGVTLDVDFDGIVGLNRLRVVAQAANGYEAGKSYNAVLTVGTVGGVSVVGEVVASFSMQRSPVNWANVTAPTTANDLSATDIQLVDTVTTYTGNTVQTGDTFALANGLTGFAAIDTVVDAIKVKTDFLPSVTAGGAGGVFIAGTNAATTITTSLTTTFTGNLTGSVASVSGAVGSVTGAVGSVTGAVGSVAGNVDGNVTGSVGSLVGHTVQTGDTYALANGATGFAAIDTVVDAIKVKTDFLPSATAGAAGGVFIAGTNAATTITTSLTTTFTGNVTGSVGSVTGAVGSVAGNVDGNVTGSVGALTSAAITDVWATDTIAEAYTTDASDGTPAQLLYEILQSLTEFAIAGTTLTVKQRDGTTATTYTLDSATVPTLRNRTT